MLSKFILLAVFVHGHGPRVNYAYLGDFNSIEACQAAASAIRKASAQPDRGAAPELPPLPAQPDELRARWKCEDCDGRGHDGELHGGDYFQPPEPGRCATCEGYGWVETAALLPEQAQGHALAYYALGRAAAVRDYVNLRAAPHSQSVRGVLDHDQALKLAEQAGFQNLGGFIMPPRTNGHITTEVVKLVKLAALPQGSQAGGQWSSQPPTEQADYWHWGGDEDHAPMIYHVLWSGSANKCFISIGQYDIREAIWCDKFGGWWMKIEQPRIPTHSTATEGADWMGGDHA